MTSTLFKTFLSFFLYLISWFIFVLAIDLFIFYSFVLFIYSYRCLLNYIWPQAQTQQRVHKHEIKTVTMRIGNKLRLFPILIMSVFLFIYLCIYICLSIHSFIMYLPSIYTFIHSCIIYLSYISFSFLQSVF